MTNQAHIDIFSDPVCPWCLVGLTRLNNAISSAKTASENPLEIDITHHPFLLDAKTPKEGEDVVEMLKRKYGRAPDEMFERLEIEGKKSGLNLNMKKQKRRNPSQRALVLIMAAAEKGSQHELALAFSHACYMDGLNINDDEVLTTIALKQGFEKDEIISILANDQLVEAIEKNARWAPTAGITGVPYFIFNNSFAFSGAQQELVFEQALERALAMERVTDPEGRKPGS
ncbi:MAG: DsbA family oxidoreductase [Devosiaceae bacterium]|nr:DsbA family oxidoreductase [Devosiaceae bacterium]